jgi:hypothetical protein
MKTLVKGSEARRYEHEVGRYIGTRTGRFYLGEPTYSVEALAHSLAQVVRFTGHSEWRYSVAEHSVMVSLLVEEMGGSLLEQLEGLLHDGTETVLADVASPVKAGLDDYKQLEKRLDGALRAQFSLPKQQTEIVTKADWIALFIEAAVLMPEHGQDFTDPNRLRPVALRYLEQGWQPSTLDDDWRAARTMFLQRYTYLKERLSGKTSQAAKRTVRQLAKDAQV